MHFFLKYLKGITAVNVINVKKRLTVLLCTLLIQSQLPANIHVFGLPAPLFLDLQAQDSVHQLLTIISTKNFVTRNRHSIACAIKKSKTDNAIGWLFRT